MSLINVQIEKFIETLFPTETAEQARLRLEGIEGPQLSPEEIKQKREDRGEFLFVLALNVGIMGFVSGVMVREHRIVFANEFLVFLPFH